MIPLTVSMLHIKNSLHFRKVEPGDVWKSYIQVKKDVTMIVHTEIERMLDTPDLPDLIIKKTS